MLTQKNAEILAKVKSARIELAKALNAGKTPVIDLIVSAVASPDEFQFAPDPHVNAYRCGRRSVIDELLTIASHKPAPDKEPQE